MQISARSYLTAGVSLTAASAIALTPLAIPANDHALTIPKVTVSDIQLTVTPAEIQAFFADLETQLEAFNTRLAEAVALPGATLAGGLQIAIDLNTDFFDTLSGLTTNASLLDLLDALYLSSDFGLTSLQGAIEEGTENLAITTGDLADLLTSTITGSLSNVLSSFVAVLNNPLSTAAYAGLLSTGVVATGQLIANNGLEAVQVLSDSGFGFAYTGLDLFEDQIFNAIDTVSDLMDVAAGATGSAIIQAVNASIQAITLAPAQAISDVAFGVTGDILGGFQEGIDDILGGAQALVAITGGSLQLAINAVGANPLNPENYLFAGGVLLAGGFDGFNTTVGTIGNVGQIPFSTGISINNGVTGVITDLNLTFAGAFSSILTALGLPAEVAGLPVVLATQLNTVIDSAAEAVNLSLTIGSNLVADGTSFVIDVSNQIEQAIFGILPAGGAGAAATTLAAPADTAAKVASEPAGDPSGGVVAVVNETDDAVEDEAPAEEAPAEEEAPASEAPAEDTAAEEAPADDEAPTDDEAPADDAPADDDEAAGDDASDDNGSYSSRSESKKADKAEKAEKADSDSSSSDSGSDSSDSGSDSGSSSSDSE